MLTQGSGRGLREGRSRILDKVPRNAGALHGTYVAIEPTKARMTMHRATPAGMRSSDQGHQETDEA